MQGCSCCTQLPVVFSMKRILQVAECHPLDLHVQERVALPLQQRYPLPIQNLNWCLGYCHLVALGLNQKALLFKLEKHLLHVAVVRGHQLQNSSCSLNGDHRTDDIASK